MNKEQELDRIEGMFIWSDNERELEDAVTDLIEYDDDLRDVLYGLVIKSVGTKAVKANAMLRLHIQVQKTLKNYAAFKAESE